MKRILAFLLIALGPSQGLSEISGTQVAKQRAEEWAQYSDDKLLSELTSAKISFEKSAGPKVFKFDYPEVFGTYVDIISKRKCFEDHKKEICKEIWEVLVARKEFIMKNREHEPTSLYYELSGLLRSNIDPVLLELADPERASGQEMLYNAYETYARFSTSIGDAFTPENMLYFQLLDGLASSNYYFLDAASKDTFLFKGITVYNLGDDDFTLIEDGLKQIMKKADSSAEPVVDEDGIIRPSYESTVKRYGERTPTILLIAESLYKNHLNKRKAVLANALYLRLDKAFTSIRDIRSYRLELIREVNDHTLWIRQADRILVDAQLLGVIREPEAVVPLLVFIVYYVKDSRLHPFPPAEHPVIQALVSIGYPSVEPTLNCYLSGTLPAEYAAEVFKGVLGTEISGIYLEKKKTAENGKAIELLLNTMKKKDSVTDEGKVSATNP